MQYFSGITVRNKLFILLFSLALPIFYLGFLEISKRLHDIKAREIGLSGLSYQGYIRPLLKFTAQHRGATSMYLSGNQAAQQQIDQARESVEASYQLLFEFDRQWQAVFNTKNSLHNLYGLWQRLDEKNLTWRKKENFRAHTDLINKIKIFMVDIGISSNLYADPDYDIRFMNDLVSAQLPALLEELGKLRGLTSGIAARQYLEDGEGAELTSLLISIRDKKDALSVNLQRSFSIDARLETLLTEPVNIFMQDADSMMSDSTRLVNDPLLLMQADGRAYFAGGTRVIEQGARLYEVIVPEMNAFLNARISQMKFSLYKDILIAFCLLLIGCAVCYFVISDLNKNFIKVIALFKSIEGEKYDNHIEVSGRTEFSWMFASLDAMQAGLKNAQQRDGRLSQEMKRYNLEYKGQVDAIGKSQAVIHFNTDGTIIEANDNFLNAVGYSLAEIKGRHHAMFVEPEYAASPEYKQFWQALNRGEYQTGEYMRIGKGGKQVWIQASYNPILDFDNKPFKIIKYASDITAQKVQAADYEGQMQAIHKSQAVIRFNMDGTIVSANDNFLHTVGYSLAEIKGRHHAMFVGAEHAASVEYKQFWQALNRGEYQAGEYMRIGKGSKQIWIQASYNPIFDPTGKVVNVVKYASDITAQKVRAADYKGQTEAIRKSQAVARFNMDGAIINANDNFLNMVGYSFDDIKGKHHAMFVESEYAAGIEYKKFWEALKRGEYQAGEYLLAGQAGRQVWIQASYNPIFDPGGKVVNVVTYASDITAEKLKASDYESQIAAISKSQAVVQFNMDGAIVSANENFLAAVGYDFDEIKGRHHAMFVDPEYAAGQEYRQFWEALNRGEYQTGEYRRVGRGGKQVWIQATYNPIVDPNGKLIKVVKYAVDITRQKQLATTTENMLGEVSKVMLAFADGNVTERVRGKYQGDFKALQDAVNEYSDKLIEIVTNIKESSNLVDEAAKEISQGNLNLSNRTESQASSLEQTSLSMEELTSTVQQNAENAQHANQTAIDAGQHAEKGGIVVNDAVVAMQEINQASKKIANIIGVIDEIAFQTNLLALNAAVEAARAGEQGRGFAVVASEVRNLAGRSATAAKEIKTLIEDSVVKVAEGTRLVNQSGDMLVDITNSVKEVTAIVSDISLASKEQASGIDAVNRAVLDIDKTTQQNAALVEQAAASAESMSQQSDNLRNLVSFFKLDQANVDQSAERRRAHRPWSPASADTSLVRAPADRIANAVGGEEFSADDDDWSEF